VQEQNTHPLGLLPLLWVELWGGTVADGKQVSCIEESAYQFRW